MFEDLEAILTDATCGEACWMAREDVCRCSCGGRNHGCLRTADGVQPVRQAKIGGMRCELRGVGGDVEKQAREINMASGIQSPYIRGMLLGSYYGAASSRDPAYQCLPAKVRLATLDQVARWPELAAWRDTRDRF